MSKKYDEYLKEHRENVKKGIDWLYDHDIIPEHLFGDDHDASKDTKEEYEAYDDYFYGDPEGKDEDDIRVIQDSFDYAWLHHIHNNPHHWQYWVLIDDDGSVTPLEMPKKAVYEMIADWWSFSWKEKNLNKIFDWYERHKDKMTMHPKTRKLVEDILEKIKKEIKVTDEEKEEEKKSD